MATGCWSSAGSSSAPSSPSCSWPPTAWSPRPPHRPALGRGASAAGHGLPPGVHLQPPPRPRAAARTPRAGQGSALPASGVPARRRLRRVRRRPLRTARRRGHALIVGGQPRAAHTLLTEALGLWRGPALAEFAAEPFAGADTVRLEELRAVAVEERVATDLALGRHATAVPELQRLIAEQPLREHLWGQLMVALYRCGRQGRRSPPTRTAGAGLARSWASTRVRR